MSFFLHYQIDKPTFGLDKKLLIEGQNDTNVKAYFNFMIDAAVVLGANRNRAEDELIDALRFEQDLAEV